MADTLGRGALCAQVAHVALAPLTSRLAAGEELDAATWEWVNGTFVKIVLEVPGKDTLMNIMERLYGDGIEFYKIYESNLGGELTCVGLKPYNKGRVAPYFTKLKLLE